MPGANMAPGLWSVQTAAGQQIGRSRKRIAVPDTRRPAPPREVSLTANSAAPTADSATARGLAAVTFATLAYGSITTLSRIAYDDGATPITLVVLRNAMFVLAIGAFLLFVRGGLALPRRAWLASLLLAFFMGLLAVGYLSSIAYIPVGLAALLFFTFPIFVALLSAVTGQDRLTAAKGLAVLLAFVGLALAFGLRPETMDWPGLSAEIDRLRATLDWRGVALALMASVAVAFAHVFVAPVFRQYDIVSVNFLAHVWMLIGLAVYGFAMRDFALPYGIDGQLVAMASMGLYIIAYSLWSLALAWIGPLRTAGMMNLEPVVSLVVAALVLDERLDRVQLAGVALVLFALVLVARGPRQRA